MVISFRIVRMRKMSLSKSLFLGPTSFYLLEHERTEREKIYVDGKNPSLTVHTKQAPFSTLTGFCAATYRWEVPTSWQAPRLATYASTNSSKACVDAQKRHDRMKYLFVTYIT